jgi:CubicO group peptidase (beta-lactamase class C family)
MKTNILQLITLFFGCCLILFTCKREQPSSTIVQQPDTLDSILNHYVDNGYYPFLYARLENKAGKLLYEHSAVNEDLLPGMTINGDSWIRIWSMSKIITIAIALDLVEDGIIHLDDPVTKYIPEFEDLQVAVSKEGIPLAELPSDSLVSACSYGLVDPDSVMTVLHLINHQAGFYYATTNISCLDTMLAEKNLPAAKNSAELIDRLAEMPLIQHPGSTYFYGTNTTVLGFVAERATGKSLDQLVKERITDPLQITGLQYNLPEEAQLPPRISGRDTVLRQAHPGELDIFGPDVPDYDPEHELYLGGEGMIATADGYADFLRMLLNGGQLNGHRFLNETTVKEMYAPQTQLNNPYGHNGYNLWVSSDSMRVNGSGDGGLWIGGGYEDTHFWVDPRRDFVGVMMTQMFWVQPGGYEKDNDFRKAIYQPLLKNE